MWQQAQKQMADIQIKPIKRPASKKIPSIDEDDVAAAVVNAPPSLSEAAKKALLDKAAKDPTLLADATTNAPSIAVSRDPHCFYPDTYETLDEDMFCSDGDPMKSKDPEVAGLICFVSYKWPDGMTGPFRAQYPKLFCPTGAKEYEDKDGKKKKGLSIMASLGDNYQNDPEIQKFMKFCDRVRNGLIKLAFNKGMGKPHHPTIESLATKFSHMISAPFKKYQDEDQTVLLKIYPPSVKLTINDAANNKSGFYLRMPPSPADPLKKSRNVSIPHTGVEKGMSICPVVQVQWIFRKSSKDPATQQPFYLYNAKSAIFQAVVYPSQSFGSGASASTLSVVSE